MGLRARLMLLVGAVVLAAVLAVALYSGVAADRSWVEVTAESEFVTVAEDALVDLDRVASWLDGAPPPSWNRILADAPPRLRETHWLLAFDHDRRFVASSGPSLDGGTISLDERGEVSMERRVVDAASGRERMESLAAQAPLATIVDRDGRPSGYLAAVPIPGAADPRLVEQRGVFRSALGGYLAFGVAAVGLLALLATHAVGARLLGPIEALTRGARAMARGNFATRVRVDRRDELGQLATAFNEMAEGLAGIEGWRQRMLDDTAHELRTPLTNLRCRIEAMEDGLAPADAAQLSALGEEVQRLSRLVDDLRDLSLAEAGRLVLHPEPLRVGELLAGVVEALSPPGQVVVEVEGDDRVEADLLRLRQVLANLLANARVHGGDGEVRVRIVGRGQAVEVHVEDRGPGLHEAEIPRLFERFYRSGDRRQGGSGLGLAIVRQWTQAHGGSVAATNREGGGARFSVSLLRRRPGAPHQGWPGSHPGPAA